MIAIKNAKERPFVKVTKEQAQQNRQALLEAAGVLFKRHGVDGVGVADICRQAGLTHGALYKHFSDKQDLAAEAFAHAFRTGFDRAAASAGSPRTLGSYLDSYMSRRVRNDPALGCPLIATACETGRQGEGLSQSFTAGFLELRDGIASALPDAGPDERDGSPDAGGDRSAMATLFVAALMGAMALSRGVLKTDPLLSDQVLVQVRDALEALAGERASSAPAA